jgi:hypothetical protein
MNNETSMTLERALELLQERAGLSSNDFFVGRRPQLVQLNASYNQTRFNCCWIHGPRRCGKSTLALRIAREKMVEGSVVFVLDTLGERGGLDKFKELLARLVSAQLGEVVSSVSVLDRIAEIASDKPVLVVVDEFDEIAADLDQSSQFELRRRVTGCDKLGFLFVSRLQPETVVRECIDVGSRLLGVTKVIRVAQLKRSEIDDLCGRLRAAQRDEFRFGLTDVRACSNLIWRCVGGHPWAAMRMLEKVACLLQLDEALTVANDELWRCLRTARPECMPHLQDFWRDVPVEVRHILHEKVIGLKTGRDSEALRDDVNDLLAIYGWDDVDGDFELAEWLAEAGKQLGVNPPGPTSTAGHISIDQIVRIQDLIYVINEVLTQNGRMAFVRVRDSALKLIHCSRAIESEEQLKYFINTMYFVFHEGAANRTETAREVNLPDNLRPIFTSARVVRDLSDIRNHYSHDQTLKTQDNGRNKRYEEFGKILKRRCGVSVPKGPSDWQRVAYSILHELAKVLESIEVECRVLNEASER